jgi:hypothetical protein
VLLDGQVVASRGGGFFAKLFGGGWPSPSVVVDAIRARSAGSTAR